MDDDRAKVPRSPAVLPRSAAAERALAEAEVRRAERERSAAIRPREIDGRAGPEPVRYGDWESRGIAYDF